MYRNNSEREVTERAVVVKAITASLHQLEEQLFWIQDETRLLLKNNGTLTCVYGAKNRDREECRESDRKHCYASCWLGNVYQYGCSEIRFARNISARLFLLIAGSEIDSRFRGRTWKLDSHS